MMKKNYTEQELAQVLSKELILPDTEKKIRETYQIIRKREADRRKKQRTKILAGISGMAAAICLGVFFVAADPVAAAKLPLIGWIFKSVEKEVSYPGDYSSQAEQLVKAEEVGREEAPDSPYVKESDGVRFTISEVYCNDMAMYLAVCLEAEEGFGDEFRESSRGIDINSIQFESTVVIDMTESGMGTFTMDPALGIEAPYYMEGRFEDDKTFAGIIRVDLTDVVSRVGQDSVSLPEHFTYGFSVTDIYANYEGKHYRGDWSFLLDVRSETGHTQKIAVSRTNGEGLGIGTITKTDYELQAELIVPEDRNRADYVVVACDAQGQPLESQGVNAEIFSLYGRDVSTITVYVCDYYTYMDECKGEGEAEKLPEKALFSINVDLKQEN